MGDFDLQSAEDLIYGDVDGDGMDGSTATVTYHQELEDAEACINPLANGMDLSAFDIYAKVENAAGCSAIVLVDLQPFTAPTFILASTPTSTCIATDGTITISGLIAMSGYNFDYQDPAGGTVTGSFTADASGSHVLTGLGAGSYMMIVVSTQPGTTVTCSSTPLEIVIDPPAPPDVSFNDIEICEGATSVPIDFTSNCTGIHNLRVDFDAEALTAEFLNMDVTSDFNFAIPADLPPGTYNAAGTITCDNFCFSSDLFSIIVIEDPMVTIMQTSDGCTDEDITFTAAPAGMDNYEFFVDTNGNGTLDAGESLQTGTSDTFTTSTLANGTILHVIASNGAAAVDCIGEAMATLVREEPCPVYDVALMKVLTSTGPFAAGQLVSFDIIVFNQGNQPVYNVLVEDYLPLGLDFCMSDNAANAFAMNPDTRGGGPAVNTMIATLPAMSSVTITIELKIAPAAINGSIINVAEITSATEDPDGMIPIMDEDDDLGNTDGGLAGENDDDVDDETAGGTDSQVDEDDFDFAALTVCNIGCNGTFPWNGQE